MSAKGPTEKREALGLAPSQHSHRVVDKLLLGSNPGACKARSALVQTPKRRLESEVTEARLRAAKSTNTNP